MSNPIVESVVFLSGVRKSIATMVEMFEPDAHDTLDYIRNEASDYELMHCMLEGELPDNKVDPEHEVALWEKYRMMILDNFDELSESIDGSALLDITENLGPISVIGLSTVPAILEFQRETGAYERLDEVGHMNTDKLKKNAMSNLKKAKDVVWDTPKKYWGDKGKAAIAAHKERQRKKAEAARQNRDRAAVAKLKQADAKNAAQAAQKERTKKEREAIAKMKDAEKKGVGSQTKWDKIKAGAKSAMTKGGEMAKKAGGAVSGAASGKYGKGVQAATIGAGVAGVAAGAYGAYKAYKARKKAKAEAAKKKAAAAKA